MTPYMTIHVDGMPETKGSYVGLGRGRVRADNPREKAWSTTVAWLAKLHMRGKLPLVSGALVTLDFVLPPPKGKKNQRDVDKLARSVLDAMSGIVYPDDEQVRCLVASKEVRDGIVGKVEINVWPSIGVRASDLVRFYLEHHPGR